MLSQHLLVEFRDQILQLVPSGRKQSDSYGRRPTGTTRTIHIGEQLVILVDRPVGWRGYGHSSAEIWTNAVPSRHGDAKMATVRLATSAYELTTQLGF